MRSSESTALHFMPAPTFSRARPATLRLVFDPDFSSARAVSAAIRGFLAEQRVPEKELFSYELCIAEACYNAIEYAEGAAREFKPVADVLFTHDQVELRVTDHTAGFALPERIPPPSPMNERGRGLFLIQSVMDEVRYLRGASENTLVMRKRRRAAGPAQDIDDPPPPGEEREMEPPRPAGDMAGELSLRSETLSAVFRCCAELGSSSEASEGFSERLLADLLRLTSADWYLLRHLSPDKRQLLVTASSDPGLAAGPIDLPAAGNAALGAEASAASSRAPARFSVRDCPEGSEPLRAVGPGASGLAYPLCFGGSLVGTISLGRRDGEFPLGQLQDELIQTLAEFLAIQTLNLRRRKDEVRNRVVARELEIAQEIQSLLLPRTLPQPAGFGLAGGWHSAREVGGDFYDAIALGGQSLLLMMVDVMGKGVPAALFATTMRGLLRGLASRSSDPAQLLSSLNRLLYKELSSVSMFITAQIVRVELQSRTVTAASAGHCPLLIIQPGRRAATALPAQGIPIGVLPDTVYHAVTETLGTPAAVLLHTDGLTDTRNSAGKPFGQRRLMAWLRANAVPGRSAAELRDSLTAELEKFRGEAAMADDQAFLLLMEEEVGAAEVPANSRRRIRIQHGSFLFPGNS